MKRASQRLRWGIVAGVAMLLMAALLAMPMMVERAVRNKVLPRVAARLGVAVEAGDIDAGWGRVTLRDVRIGDTAAIARLDIKYAVGAAIAGRGHIKELAVQSPTVTVQAGAAGQSNLQAMLARLRGNGEAAGGSGSRSNKMVVDVVTIRDGTVAVSDEATGLAIAANGIAGHVQPSARTGDATIAEISTTSARGPRLVARQLKLRADESGAVTVKIGDGAAALWSGFSLTNLSGTISSQTAQKFDIDLGGSYGGANEPLWTAKGWFDVDSQAGDLTVAAKEFSLARIANVLPTDVLQSLEQTKLDASLQLMFANKRLRYEGSAHIAGLTIFHPMIASAPLVDLDFAGKISGWVDLVTRAVVLESAELSTHQVPFSLRAEVLLPLASRVGQDGTPQPAASVTAALVVPPVPCQTALRAVPSAIAPFLQDFKLQGSFAADIAVSIDWNDLDALTLNANIGLDRCQVLKAPAAIGERLKNEFVHHVEIEKDQWQNIVVGPSNPDFIAYASLPPHVVFAAMTTEDPRFLRHRGFLPSEFEKALAENLKAGYFRLGASSITMQLVKNVLLYREKTLSRKFQELFLTWHIEHVLTKERMLEIYFNVVEYGPGIYGVAAAAREYFAKPVGELTVKEAVFLAKLLPSPKARYRQYCEGTLRKWMEDGIGMALERMLQKTWITQAQFDDAMATQLAFAPMTETREACLARVKKAIANARSTSPGALQPSDADKDL